MFRNWITFWVIPVTIIFAIGTVWLRLSIIRTTYRIHQSRQQIEKAKQERSRLQLKVAALRSPHRLESLARRSFRLSQPKIEQVIRFDRNDLVESFDDVLAGI